MLWFLCREDRHTTLSLWQIEWGLYSVFWAPTINIRTKHNIITSWESLQRHDGSSNNSEHCLYLNTSSTFYIGLFTRCTCWNPKLLAPSTKSLHHLPPWKVWQDFLHLAVVDTFSILQKFYVLLEDQQINYSMCIFSYTCWKHMKEHYCKWNTCTVIQTVSVQRAWYSGKFSLCNRHTIHIMMIIQQADQWTQTHFDSWVCVKAGCPLPGRCSIPTVHCRVVDNKRCQFQLCYATKNLQFIIRHLLWFLHQSIVHFPCCSHTSCYWYHCHWNQSYWQRQFALHEI